MDGNWRGIGGDGKFGRVRYEGTRRGKEKSVGKVAAVNSVQKCETLDRRGHGHAPAHESR